MMMKVINVFLTDDCAICESIYVSGDLTKDEITKEVNKQFDYWYSYDIV